MLTSCPLADDKKIFWFILKKLFLLCQEAMHTKETFESLRLRFIFFVKYRQSFQYNS